MVLTTKPDASQSTSVTATRGGARGPAGLKLAPRAKLPRSAQKHLVSSLYCIKYESSGPITCTIPQVLVNSSEEVETSGRNR